MGYHSLIAFSHDSFDSLEKNALEFITRLRYYMNSGNSEAAEHLERASGFSAHVVAMRHHSENFTIGSDKHGFPAKLPYQEQQANKIQQREQALSLVAEVTGNPKKRRTVMELLDVLYGLLKYTQPARETSTKLQAADARATALLSNTEWRPTRAHYESLRNELRRAHEQLEAND